MTARTFRLLLALMAIVAGGAAYYLITLVRPGDEVETAPVLIEFGPDGAAVPEEEQESVGRAELIRSADGISTKTEIEGLRPGGVYTFWLVVYQGESEFPDDYFVNKGRGVVAGDDGRVAISMKSSTGDTSIEGWYVEDLGTEAKFAELYDPLGSQVRVEIVYHGQADRAGDQLNAWLTDFWTGDPEVCANPLGTLGTGAVPEHPYCAGYWAATFAVEGSEGPRGATRAVQNEDE